MEFRKVKDKEIWDGFVQSQDRYSFVQSWNYTEVLKTLCCDLRRIGVYEDEELIGLLPLMIIRARRGNYLRMRHGPILDYRNVNSEFHMKGIVSYLKRYAKEKSLSFVRVQPIWQDNLMLIKNGFQKAPTHNLDGEQTLQLRLQNSKQEEKVSILQQMRKNTRYYIRKAEKEGTKIVLENDDFESFYSLFIDTTKRQDYTPWPKQYYLKLFESFNPGERNLYFAEVGGKKVALGLFIDYGRYRFYLEGALDINYSRYYPAYAIQWQSICDAIDKQLEIYDFWGGVSPKDENGKIVKNDPWAGINLFKEGFGGQQISMLHPHDLPLSWKYGVTKVFEWLEKKRRGY
jgi:lipid II:glycine glycyltransferase (peptidoglycan interpeptide bridge formation enzyme)